MLQKLNDEVRECYQHAKDCAGSAAAQTDPAVQQSFFGCAAKLAKAGSVARRRTRARKQLIYPGPM